jgi:hypothetical protein
MALTPFLNVATVQRTRQKSSLVVTNGQPKCWPSLEVGEEPLGSSPTAQNNTSNNPGLGERERAVGLVQWVVGGGREISRTRPRREGPRRPIYPISLRDLARFVEGRQLYN